MKRFDPETYYKPSDPEMRMIATEGTLTQWRHFGRGPAYSVVGRRILYLGEDLNAFVDAGRVQPAEPVAS